MAHLRDLVRGDGRRGPELPAWIERIASTGIVTADPEIGRRQRFTNIGIFACAANAISHLVINSLYDARGLAIVNVYNVILAGFVLLLPRLHRRGDNAAAIALISAIMGGHLFAVMSFGLASDLQVYFTLLGGGMVFLFGVQHWRLILVYFVLIAAELMLVMRYAPVDGLVLPHDGALRDTLSSQAMFNTLAINAGLIFYALNALRRAEAELQYQFSRSETLLAAMLPPTIAARLKSGGDAKVADRIENLSVMFADLVGFTRASHDLPPDRVVSYLDELMHGFEGLCEKFGVDKIKSIGDGCMAVAGLEGDAQAGARQIGELALTMLARNAARPPLGNHKLGLRIGLHCGDAIAGVIGGTRFSYDVWGDAVNIAARLESTSETDRIQVSEAFRALAGDAFVYEARGTTTIKGIGDVMTYWLVGMNAGG